MINFQTKSAGFILRIFLPKTACGEKLGLGVLIGPLGVWRWWLWVEGLGSAIARPLSHSYGAIARNYPYP